MVKRLVIVLLVLQSFAFAGPVCGNHSTTVESMECCEKGHDVTGDPAVGDSHSGTCCATCDMGKASGTEPKKDSSPTPNVVIEPLPGVVLISQMSSPSIAFVSDHLWEDSFSPPDIVILKQSFRI